MYVVRYTVCQYSISYPKPQTAFSIDSSTLGRSSNHFFQGYIPNILEKIMHIVIYAIILGFTSKNTLATNSTSTCFEGVLCIPLNYAKSVRPYLNQTNNIFVQLKKLKVIKVSDFDSTIKLSLELSLEWKDSRIIISEKNLDNSKILTLNKNLLDLLWIPEIYIYDLHSIKKHAFIQASENLILIKKHSLLQYR